MKLKRKLVYQGHGTYQLVDVTKCEQGLSILKDINPLFMDIAITNTVVDENTNDDLMRLVTNTPLLQEYYDASTDEYDLSDNDAGHDEYEWSDSKLQMDLSETTHKQTTECRKSDVDGQCPLESDKQQHIYEFIAKHDESDLLCASTKTTINAPVVSDEGTDSFVIVRENFKISLADLCESGPSSTQSPQISENTLTVNGRLVAL